jgi:RNA-binding protein 39
MVEQLIALTEDDVRTTFEPFGPVDLVEIPKDESGRLTGSAFVTFSKGESAKNAIETLNSNFLLNGKQIKVMLV